MEVSRPGGTLRAVLLIGFGGLFLLLVVAGWQALSTVQRLHEDEQAERRDFLARNRALIQFRSGLDQYGNRVEQYFLTYQTQNGAPDPDIPALILQVRSALDGYPPDREPEEQAMLATLQVLLADQQKAMSSGVSSRKFYGEILPRNRQLASAAEKVAVWNNDQYGHGAGHPDRFGQLRGRLSRLLIIVLASGLLLAIGSIMYIARQDREARRRYAELSINRNALSELSAKLLDAQEEERRSISRELHDEVGQSLGALLVDVGRLSAQLPVESVAAHEQLGRMKRMAEESVKAVRNMALLLRPSMLDDLGLIPALEWQAREVSRRGAIEVEIESESVSESLPEEYKVCIYRMTQEALNNSSRHSGGSHAWVHIRQTPDIIALTVRDDGHGFDPAKTRGLGLLGMEERVRRLGGKLRINSRSGGGSELVAELPLRQAVAA